MLCFIEGDWDLGNDGLEVLGGDGATLFFGGFDPCAEGKLIEGSGNPVGCGAEEVDGGGFEKLAFESGLAEAVPEIGFDLIGCQGRERADAGDAALRRSMAAGSKSWRSSPAWLRLCRR